jgi:hypothetical protein
MKRMSLVLFFILFVAADRLAAAEYMNPEQVSKEFKEPGHIPQGLKPSSYHPLDEVISKSTQKKIRSKKIKAKKKQGADLEILKQMPIQSPTPAASPKSKDTSSSSWFFSSAYAAEMAPQEAPQSLPQMVDMRKWDTYIRNQWDGTCTAHGLIAGMENLYNRNNPAILSTRYFWSKYRQYSVEVAMDTAAKYQQVDEVYWPQNQSRPVTRDLASKGKYLLTQQEYLGDDVNLVVKSLAQGYPVYVGMSVPQDMAACRSTIRYTTGVTDGGHALAVVGYRLDSSVRGGGYLILKNSWGSDCGDNGYQYFPFALCGKEDMYCLFWALKKVA